MKKILKVYLDDNKLNLDNQLIKKIRSFNTYLLNAYSGQGAGPGHTTMY